MDASEKDFLRHLIEKYGAPAVVREIKNLLASMIDLDWCFDRGRWERQLNNLNRDLKLRHNLSRVAKELAIANEHLRRFRDSAEMKLMSYEIAISSHRRERQEKKRLKEQAALAAIAYREAQAKREATLKEREEKRAATMSKLMKAHQEYMDRLSKQ